jgi:UDP-N-acetylmuramoyl-tripeptide--D-alanyl-D-alanine ligase
VSDFSDFGKNRIHRLRHLGRAAARSADLALFVGESAAYGRRRAIEAGMPAEQAREFRTLEEAARFLRAELGRGDLLLLKGRTTDHVTRVYHALIGTIECWKVACGRYTPCDRCWELGARPETEREEDSTGPPCAKAAPTSP